MNWTDNLGVTPSPKVLQQGTFRGLDTYQAREAQRVRWEVMEHYGGNPPRCACCGEDQPEFLALDHIEGGGNAQRKKLGFRGVQLHRWLRKNGYPEGYRVLCHNCNNSLGHYGFCPHALEMAPK